MRVVSQYPTIPSLRSEVKDPWTRQAQRTASITSLPSAQHLHDGTISPEAGVVRRVDTNSRGLVQPTTSPRQYAPFVAKRRHGEQRGTEDVGAPSWMQQSSLGQHFLLSRISADAISCCPTHCQDWRRHSYCIYFHSDP